MVVPAFGGGVRMLFRVMRTVLLPAILSHAACDPGPTCGEVDLGLPVSAAVAGPGVALSGQDLSVAVNGTVEAVGAGEAPDVDGGKLIVGKAGAPDPWWIRFRSEAGEPWTATIAAGGSTAPAVGSKVNIRAEAAPLSFQGTAGSVRVGLQDGTLVAWVGQAYAVKDLAPPSPLKLGVGAAMCRSSEDCGDWSGHSLVVVLEDDVTDVVPYGAWKTVGKVGVHNGGVVVDDASGGCPDFFRGSALVAVSAAP